jgi:hypothetical protein
MPLIFSSRFCHFAGCFRHFLSSSSLSFFHAAFDTPFISRQLIEAGIDISFSFRYFAIITPDTPLYFDYFIFIFLRLLPLILTFH